MTLKEKIKALVHYDLIAKLKDILLDFSGNLDNTIEEAPEDGNQYARQDGTWTEVTGGGGGSQDLQSVLNNGATADLSSNINIYGATKKIHFGTEYSNDLDSVHMSLSGQSYWDIGQRISIYMSDSKASLNFDGNGANFMGTSTDGLKSGTLYLGGGSTSGTGFVLTGSGKSALLNLDLSNTSRYFNLELDADNSLAVFKDTTNTPKGIQYGADYSVNFTDRSIVDKAYVDSTATANVLNIDLDSRVYADNASAITGGLVAKDIYRTVTGELRIVI
jgi:hypothetical protein